MIITIEDYNRDKYAHLLDEMFRLRARVFRDRLGWDVEVSNGLERDKYDSYSPVYLIYTDDEARIVKGSLRLLPTTGPTLLSDIFSDTIPNGAHLTAPSIWECTRFCLDRDQIGNACGETLLSASGVLLVGLGDVALKAGIETILGNFDPIMIRLYRRIGCEVEVLGSAYRNQRPVYFGSFAVSERILRRMKARLEEAKAGAAAPTSERAFTWQAAQASSDRTAA